MKKQIGLLAITALFVLFMAFSGVASAQASNVQVLFFESPMCSVCQQVKPLVESAAAQTGAKLIVYDVSQSPGTGIAKANGISGTPTIVIQGGQTLVGAVTEQQIVAAIQAAAGSATPTPKAVTPTPKAVATPTHVPVVKATATPKVVKATTTKVVKATATPKVVKAMTTTNTQPSIQVVTATKTPTASTQTVPEFSLLGLGAPALVVGAIYLFLRKR
jgi:thioredoxin-like negative regulator of GroEL